ncbi:MAG: GNAT family N-acetyltransferase [Myxococcaceae bacterium]
MTVTVRPARPSDADDLGRMGAALARLHHAWDEQRFMLAESLEDGYRSWLSREAENKKAVVLVAELEARVVGYAYGRAEGRDWNMLVDPHGGFHDLWVDAEARCHGVGEKLVLETIERFKALGVPRIVLHTAAKNEAAQRFFAKQGWRPTMVEMTREL